MTTTGVDLISAERDRQVTQLGYTFEHDAAHDDDDLAFAAACYAAPTTIYLLRYTEDAHMAEHGKGGRVEWVEPWPLDWERNVPLVSTPENRVRSLAKAGALIAAEIDRILARQPEADDE